MHMGEQRGFRPTVPKTAGRNDEEAACIQLLFQINEILYSIILRASEYKEEIPALRTLLFHVEGMTPELRAELDVHAAKLQEIFANRDDYRDDAFWAELAICCHQMVKILQVRLGYPGQ